MDRTQLRLTEGFGFGHGSFGQILVKAPYEAAGAGVVNIPEGSEDCFCFTETAYEIGANAENFLTVGVGFA